MKGRNFFEERIQAPATDGEATGTTIPSQAPQQVSVGDKRFHNLKAEGISWREFWNRLAQHGFVKSADTVEYQTRTAELTEQNILTIDEDLAQSVISKSNARKEFFRYYEGFEFLA